MISFFLKSTYFKIGAILAWLFLAVGGLLLYTGSSLIYILFSAVFLCLLVDGLFRRISLAYTFLIIFLWLGFWLKLVVHLCLDYQYLEPIGYFNNTPEEWDSVLTVSTVGAAAVMTTKILLSKYESKHAWGEMAADFHAPSWYSVLRPWLWSFALIFIIFIAIINSLYGIAQLGPVPLLLPWPLTGLMAWLLSFGIVAMVLSLVSWDHAIGRGWGMGLFGVIFEGFISSVSSMSRATYIFHTLPYMIVLYVKRLSLERTRLRTKVAIFSVWILIFIFSLSFVTLSRHSDILTSKGSSDKTIAVNEVNVNTIVSVSGSIFNRVSHLVVDRWIGIEGVMATVAYPTKNIELFKYALQERRIREKSDIFTSEISQSGFTDSDAKEYQYASIPGAIAFFYYTGSLWWVFVGMVVLSFLMMVSERVVYVLTKNMYLCAFWSMNIAQTVACFGLGVAQSATYHVTCFVAMVAIWMIQKKSPASNLLPD